LNKKAKYYDFDQQKLIFRKEKKISAHSLLKVLFILVIAVLANFLFFKSLKHTPESIVLKLKRTELINQFLTVETKVDTLHSRLSYLQYRDEKIYRPVLDKSSLPQTIREAGTGGSEKSFDEMDILANGIVANIHGKLDVLNSKLSIQDKSYTDLTKTMAMRQQWTYNIPAIQPIKINTKFNIISSYFGLRYHPIHGRMIMHDGVDFVGQIGDPVYATGGGTIEVVKHSNVGYGNEVLINHGFGLQTRYGHLEKILVVSGQKVERGEQIATLGNSGTSTGAHVHYEVIKDGKVQDPLNYFVSNMSYLEYEKILKK